jgi:TonB family protein
MKPLYLIAFLLSTIVTSTRAQVTAHDTSAGARDTSATAHDTTSKVVTFTKFMIQAWYPGGDLAWNKYLGKNLHYPDAAVDNGISGTVIVQFVVDVDSTISDVQAVSGPTKGGLREEAVRVITQSGKWIPAIQNGKVVKSFVRRPISFVIQRG